MLGLVAAFLIGTGAAHADGEGTSNDGAPCTLGNFSLPDCSSTMIDGLLYTCKDGTWSDPVAPVPTPMPITQKSLQKLPSAVQGQTHETPSSTLPGGRETFKQSNNQYFPH